MLERAGYDAFETPDIRRDLWKKMSLWLAVAPSIAAITGLTLDKLTSDPGGFAIMTSIMRESIELGRRLGFELADDADEQVRVLS